MNITNTSYCMQHLTLQIYHKQIPTPLSKTLLLGTLRKKCPYSELFWSVFSHIRTEYGEIRNIFRYSVRMRENADQNNSEYGHFSRSDTYTNFIPVDRKLSTVSLKSVSLLRKGF